MNDLNLSSRDGRSPILEVCALRRTFGGVVAVSDCTFEVHDGITGIIGPNGAGKSTMANLISGMLRSDQGSIRFRSDDITGLSVHKRARMGLVRSFQLSRQFLSMTVLENVMVASREPDDTLTGAFLRRSRMRANERTTVTRAMAVLADVGLDAKCNDYARNLSGGQMRLLELARAFIAEPTLVILDEPTAGVSPVLIDRITVQLERLVQAGTSIMLVEHNLRVVEDICSTVIVMASGRVLASGSLDEHRENSDVVAAYLGTGA
jgi:ABC-type branched-subunit amino acid transport system ATPase component